MYEPGLIFHLHLTRFFFWKTYFPVLHGAGIPRTCHSLFHLASQNPLLLSFIFHNKPSSSLLGLNNSYPERPPVFLVGSSYLRLHYPSSPWVPLAFHNTNHNLHLFSSLTVGFKNMVYFSVSGENNTYITTTPTSHPCIAQDWAFGIHSLDEFLSIN